MSTSGFGAEAAQRFLEHGDECHTANEVEIGARQKPGPHADQAAHLVDRAVALDDEPGREPEHDREDRREDSGRAQEPPPVRGALAAHLGPRRVREDPVAVEHPLVDAVAHPEEAVLRAHDAGEPEDADERVGDVVDDAPPLEHPPIEVEERRAVRLDAEDAVADEDEVVVALARPALDWIKLADGMGVEATRVETLEGFADAFKAACAQRGPFLIEFQIY